MSVRSSWDNNSIFSECPSCLHLGPHQPDALGMLGCDVCGTTFAPASQDADAGTVGSYLDTGGPEAIDSSWIPTLPEAAS